MAVRNFWVRADIDGRVTPLAGGPRAKDGGFSLDIYQRVDGLPQRVISIEGRAYDDGTLSLFIKPVKGTKVQPYGDGLCFHSKR